LGTTVLGEGRERGELVIGVVGALAPGKDDEEGAGGRDS